MEKEKKQNLLITILSVITVLLLCMLIYLLFFNKKEELKPTECPKCQECTKCESQTCNCPNNTTNLGEKVGSIKKINITDKNQTFKVGKKEYKIRKGTGDNYDKLSINDYFVKISFSTDEIGFSHAYLTDKFIIFTSDAQDGEMICYVQGENGEIVANNNEYQMNSFKVVDGYLYAKGHVFEGVDAGSKDKDLLIKYIDNTLIVTESK